MRHQLLAIVCATLACLMPTSALAQAPGSATWAPDSRRAAALKWEIGYLALSALDTYQTVDCLNKGICSEANPLFGKHPKPAKLIAAKLAAGAIHFAVFTRANARDSKTALRFAQLSAGIQGGVVLLNARFMFK